jgi:hypothetical protein
MPAILLDSGVVREQWWGLLPDHYDKVVASGLRRETVEAAQLYSETRADYIACLLGRRRFEGPALAFPYFDRHGKPMRADPIDYVVLRPSYPRERDGDLVKYEMRACTPPRAYFPPLACCRHALHTLRVPLLITEGILKALAAAQCGLPCIGLMGMWNWTKKRRTDTNPRELLPELAELDWRDRPVLIVVDADPERKPIVFYGATELARVLTEAGAQCRLVRPPPGPIGADGKPTKMAVDDFLVARGKDALLCWVQTVWTVPPAVELEAYRPALAAARRGAIRRGGEGMIHLDRSPTGAGKTYADGVALQVAQAAQRRTLTLVGTHEQACDVERQMLKQGIGTELFPQLTAETCTRYDEAQAVLHRGLPFTMVLCDEPCPYRDSCGYRARMAEAMGAPNAVATHARGAISLPLIAGGRDVFLIHENPQPLLCPTHIAAHSLKLVGTIANEAADLLRRHPQDKDVRFYRYLARLAQAFDNELHHAYEPVEVAVPEPARYVPEDVYPHLNNAVIRLGIGAIDRDLQADAMLLVLGVALGEIRDVYVGMEERPRKDGEVEIRRYVIGYSKTVLPEDATAPPADLQKMIPDRRIEDLTPTGTLPLKHPCLQVIPDLDVTKGRTPEGVLPILRGLLYDLPQYQRIGLLTHQELAKALPAMLSERDRSRLEKVSYFGGADSRGVNSWYRDCDCLIVLGTPRVPRQAIQAHLLRLGNPQAACLKEAETGWQADWWSAVTASGKRRTVRTPHFTNRAWHAAYCSLVRGELRQCLGRGRSILPDGIPVYVVSTENLALDPDDDIDGVNGLLVADFPTGAPLTDPQARVLDFLYPTLPCGMRVRRVRKSSAIAAAIECNRARAHKILVELETAGRVTRKGKCGGWYPTHESKRGQTVYAGL